MKCPLGIEWGEDVFFFRLARHALLEGLKLVGIQPGDSVLLPEFICRELLASIHLAGARTVFYPVDSRLCPMSFPNAKALKAVLAVNYFGFPQELEPFRELCRANRATLIEDNAHGFLSRDPLGHLLGSRGDLGILSLRKTFPLLDGGALVVNKACPGDRLPEPLAFRSDPIPITHTIKSLCRSIQSRTGIPLKKAGERVVRIGRQLRTGNAFPRSSPDCESSIPGPIAMHQTSFNRLSQQDMPLEVERRRQLFLTMQAQLKGFDLEPVFPDLPEGTAPYGYPFRADDSTAAEVAALASKIGFDCSRWPELPEAIVASAPSYYRNVFWVNFLC